MKKKLVALILAIMVMATGCQSVAKDFGGTTELKLPANEKLEMITWKGDSLWYLTRPMRDDEIPEVHVFNESTDLGLMEGSVIVIESTDEIL